MSEEKALAVHQPSALDVYGDSDDIKRLAKRVQMCLPGGNRLQEAEALSLAQLSVAYQLNPFNGEVWHIPGSGTMVGIKGLRKAARKQAQYWVEHVLLTQQERQDLQVPDKAIAYKCLVYRTDLIRQSAEVVKIMRDAGMADAVERYAYKPSVGIGYWTPGEKSRMKPDQLARKRAETEALKVAFDLPFASEIGNGDRVGYVDAEEWEVLASTEEREVAPQDDWNPAILETGEEHLGPGPIGDLGITSPQALLKAVNEATVGYYNAIPHMANALDKITGQKVTGWPTTAGEYKELYDLLVQHAKDQQAQKTA